MITVVLTVLKSCIIITQLVFFVFLPILLWIYHFFCVTMYSLESDSQFPPKKKKRILVGLWFIHVLLDSLADIAAGLSGIVFKILFSNFLLSLYKIQLIQYIDLISCHLGNLLLTSNNCFVGFFWYFLCKQTYQLKIETVIPVSFQTLYFLLPFFFFWHNTLGRTSSKMQNRCGKNEILV